MWGQTWGTMMWGGAHFVPLLSPLGLAALVMVFLVGGIMAQTRRRQRWAGSLFGIGLAMVPLIAVAALSLPHTFSNGTVADADEVNENFDTIVGDFARYHLVLTGASAGNSTPIPGAVISQLCRDDDGCAFTVLSRNANGLGDFPDRSEGFLYVNSVNDRYVCDLPGFLNRRSEVRILSGAP